jgi:preprotein translocase subunit SecE
MSTQRILLLSYLVLGVLVSLVFQDIFLNLGNFSALDFLHTEVAKTPGFWSYVLGFALGGGIGIFCWRDPRVKEPATQVVEELQRVTWPTFAETRAATWAVIVATLVCAVLLGLFDYGWGAVTAQIYAGP